MTGALRRKFLLDSGAGVSTIPPTPTQENHPDEEFSLQSTNGRHTQIFGQIRMTLDLGLLNNSSVGAALNQWVDESWQQLSFFLSKLKPNETRHSSFSPELLAMFLAIRHFRHLLESRDFTMYTDNNPLVNALKASFDMYNPRETAQIDYISQFTSDIRRYVK